MEIIRTLKKEKSWTLLDVYHTLYRAYGPQGWWPLLSMADKIVKDAKFDSDGYHQSDYSCPQDEAQQWEVIVGAILTQNTSWKNVEKAMRELYQHGLATPESIFASDETHLAARIQSAGYFNQKARRLKIVAQFFLDHPDILTADVSLMRTALLEVNGIGPETADSIILYAAKKPSFVVDTYTKRIMTRFGMVRKDAAYDELQHSFMEALPRDAALFNEYHALLVEHAKQYCRTKPLCNACPLASQCKKLI